MEEEKIITALNEQWSDIYIIICINPMTNRSAIRWSAFCSTSTKKGKLRSAMWPSTSGFPTTPLRSMFKRLMKKGFVRKSRSGSDERKVIVVFTQEGKTALHRHTMLAEEKLKRLLNHFSAADLETIQKAFALLSEGTKRCFQS